MQSGISASAELRSAFQSLLSSTSERGLLVKISSETLVPVDVLHSSSPDFLSDLDLLSPYLKPNEALYILLRRDASSASSTGGGYVAITYVPNAAPVRQKMLFASTRLTLVRELGSEHFGESFFTTEASELTAEGWKKHEAHTKAERPLTEEERNAETIREIEAQEGGGASRRGGGYGSSGLKIRVGDGVEDKLKNLQDGDGDIVLLKIDVPTETVVLASQPPSGVSPDSLATAIPSDGPHYTFYRYTYTSPTSASSTNAVIFVYTCPTASKIKERMIYASSRANIVAWAEQVAGLKVDKKLEFTDPSEISSSSIEEEFVPKEETKTGFARPKKPGKR
ncbi:actin depolymerizing protein [Aulographum hederae CBS 113979]|uniref:Twinfilin n=1 Tax=Aulographum hederae CBS 113979 TaxID=1176131 RepID=A0A6G1H3X3_9PEZI|nr:actin depolymerizing protein [Aulographum hederae CBS 113979]